MSERIPIEAVKRRAQEAVAVKGDGAIGMSRRAGQDVLALVTLAEAAHLVSLADIAPNLKRDALALDRLDSALARFDFEERP